jgi:hypothetical protein
VIASDKRKILILSKKKVVSDHGLGLGVSVSILGAAFVGSRSRYQGDGTNSLHQERWQFRGWPARKAGGRRLSSTPLDTPCRAGLVFFPRPVVMVVNSMIRGTMLKTNITN